jgi:transcriptional antiterminator NusG
MIGAEEEAKKKDIEELFIVEENVKILDGPFSSMIATIEAIDGEKVTLSVSIFGRKTPMEMNINQISKV